MKEFLKSPKKTAIIGLIGSIIMLLDTLLMLRYHSIVILFIQNSIGNLYTLGLVVYFIIILTRMYKQKGNLKIANMTLLITYILSLIAIIFVDIAQGESILIDIVVFGTMILYLCNILFGKIKFINNKIFAVIIICYSLYQLIQMTIFMVTNNGIDIYMVMYWANYLGYIAIIPYFYNYYELLKEEK